jgi:vesicle-associated membrane protein 7
LSFREDHSNFAFLQSIQKEFVDRHRAGRIKTANAYALDKNFAPTVRSAMHYHNIHHKDLRQDAKVTVLLAQVSNMRDVMGRNLHMILDRGDYLEELLDKSETASADASIFRKRARTAKRIMQRRYYFWYAVMAFIVVVFLYMSLVSMCGLKFEYCRERGGSSTDSSSSSGSNSNQGGNANNQANGNGGRRILLI